MKNNSRSKTLYKTAAFAANTAKKTTHRDSLRNLRSLQDVNEAKQYAQFAASFKQLNPTKPRTLAADAWTPLGIRNHEVKRPRQTWARNLLG